MRQVKFADVPVTINPDVPHLDRMLANVTNQCRTHQESVPIIMDAAAVIVIEGARLDRISLVDEVLPENIPHVNILMPRVEAIQAAIRILLQHREVDSIKLDSIIVSGAKHPKTEIVIRKNKAPKV